MRIRTVIVACLATIVLFAGGLVAQEDRHFLESKVFVDRERPGVQFNHLLHSNSLDCMDCHHDYVNGENVWDMYSDKNHCSDCHAVQSEGKVIGLMQAFHESCVGCHRKTIKRGMASGPVMCGDCHVRR